MADNINVNPTPIQRNSNDVALELTLFYYKDKPSDDIKEIQETYTKFYVLADTLYRNRPSKFENLLPEFLNK